MDYQKRLLRKPIVRIIAFVLIFILLDNVIGTGLKCLMYADKPDMNSLMWSDFYQQKKNSIDVMFVGSSHARFAFNTAEFDKALEQKTFNLSSSDQTPVVGYYALQEALKYQKPKVVVYEAYWRKFGTEDNTTPAYFVYDYIKDVRTKAGLLASLYGDKAFDPFLEEALSKTYKYRDNFLPIMKSLAKGQVSVNPYCFSQTVSKPIAYEDFQYAGDGYFSSVKVVSSDTLYNKNSFKTATFSWNDKQLDYFQKTLQLCKDNHIKVLVVTAPLPRQSIDDTKEYVSYSEKITKICKENGLEYLDYNLLNQSGTLFSDRDFMDTNHLNSRGALILDQMLILKLKAYMS